MGILVLFYGLFTLQGDFSPSKRTIFPGLACLMAWTQFETICLRNPRYPDSWGVWCLKGVIRVVTLILALLISSAQP